MTGRRAFLALAGGAAAAVASVPRASWAQQQAMPVIGYLGTGSAVAFADRLRAFHQGLRETGFTEGRNVRVEYRWANDQYDQLARLVDELIRHPVSVIVVPGSTPGALAAKAATSTIPVVFATAVDPVEAGLVASLNRPGGNLTGVATLAAELGPKQLQLLHEVVPNAGSAAVLVNPTSPVAAMISRELQTAARTLGLQLHILHASNARDLEQAFADLTQLRAGALVIGPDGLFTSQVDRLATLAARHAVPALYSLREFATAGGLMSYGYSIEDWYRLVGVYTGRILKGDRPADLPVQQSTKVQLFLNLKTAKALGITVPLTLLGRADEVIE
jgi:putative ABC transport system substrate-binding protein